VVERLENQAFEEIHVLKYLKGSFRYSGIQEVSDLAGSSPAQGCVAESRRTLLILWPILDKGEQRGVLKLDTN